MTNVCLHAFISGKVQGVSFRAETQKRASELKLCGWVRNTDDNRVEVMACGEETAINSLKIWLSQGPAKAKVSAVQVAVCPYEIFPDFSIRI